MARAKNTDRAEARRRHREQTRTVDIEAADADIVEAAPQQTSGGMRGMFRIPTRADIREDIRTFPQLLLHTRKLWIPYVMLLVSFVLAVLLTQGTTVNGEVTGTVFPAGISGIVSMYVTLTLPPTALFVFFIGGFLAPRASYLVGATLGILDGILWSLLFLISPSGSQQVQNGITGTQPTAEAHAPALADYALIMLFAIVVGVLAAGFASWYRSFLRQSQERARQNRIAREQQQRLKAKEDAKVARDAQRQASTAARQAKSVTPTTTSVPPSKR